MLKFRNLDMSPEAPVEQWGFEGLLTALERGNIEHWRRVSRALDGDPRGKVAAELAEVVEALEDNAIANLFSRLAGEAVGRSEQAEKDAVAAELRRYFAASGLKRSEFARRLGSSPSRLSTYLNGKVTPSAVLLIRARSLADRVPG
ncbi:helix-turn-helix transcriptional regulator [Arthrobacter sp. H5]|uniref:helix-turn-helix domain-containing protein n=1 Tax=Arthrobacter sp. H5 TaxID=1267973 RepID=UPI0004B3D4F5|nr:helix-turn-helix transcriptional regulator [Arthrobacter sp. H5]